jgi:hypothetical protein
MYTLNPISKGNDQDFLDLSKEKDSLCRILNKMKGTPKFMEFEHKGETLAIEFISGVDNFLEKSQE